MLISKAVLRNKYESHVCPSALIEGKLQDLPKTLQDLLLPHPFPCSRMPHYSNVTRELIAKTTFSPSDTQACARWVPEVMGTTAWTGNQGQVTYKVTDLDLKIEGAASTIKKNLVYICKLLGCVVECPCNICTETSNISEMLSCENCGNTFSLLSNMKRHQWEQHVVPKFNLKFHEGWDPAISLECDICDIWNLSIDPWQIYNIIFLYLCGYRVAGSVSVDTRDDLNLFYQGTLDLGIRELG